MAASTPIDLVPRLRSGTLGNILWNDKANEIAQARLGTPSEEIRLLLHQFVVNGSLLDERKEGRKVWLKANDDRPPYYRDYWYRAVISVPGLFQHGLFVECRLFDDDAKEPWVEIVGAHPQTK